jgi:C-7 ketoreductase
MGSSTGNRPRAIIVTGGGTGIGKATARAFADDGDNVLIVGRSEHALTAAATDDERIRTLSVDLTAPAAAQLVVQEARTAFGRIDVLVNNAGAGVFGQLGSVRPESFQAQLDINLRAPTLLTQAALDALRDSKGLVVNVSSAGSLHHRAWPGNAIYGASKAALDLLTRSWAVELAPQGVRVVGVAPGVMDTGIGERIGMSADEYAGFLQQMAGRVPLGRVGRPEDVAWWILQLARPEAGYVTGSVLAIDGGLSLT